MTGEQWVQFLGLVFNAGAVGLLAAMNTKLKFLSVICKDHEERLRVIERRKK